MLKIGLVDFNEIVDINDTNEMMLIY